MCKIYILVLCVWPLIYLVLLYVGKLNETSYPDEGFESSRDAENMPVNGNASNSESSSKRLRKRWDSPRDSFQTHDSTFSNKENGHTFDPSPKYLGASKQSDFELSINEGIGGGSSVENALSEETKDPIRYSQVQSKKDFSLIERVDGRDINVLQGLELHTQVFNPMEQSKIVECIYRLQWRGMHGKLRGICEAFYSFSFFPFFI